jgi:type II secretion system protein J
MRQKSDIRAQESDGGTGFVPSVNALKQPGRSRGFTLAELLVTVGVLVLLVLLATQLLNSAATITTLGHKQMDVDSQARQLLDRMAIDFAQMVKRSDVDYYVKSPANPETSGNDQIAFHSTVAGYYPTGPTATQKSPLSLVAYRLNSGNRLERMGKGLVWNGVSSGTPIVFLPLTISGTWPTATNGNPDTDYEEIGPQIFRFEYYYLLNNGSLLATPWYTTTSVHGMQDVSAVLSNSDITTLAQGLADYSGQAPGALLANWRTTLDGNTSLPRPALSGIRLYERYFHLSPPTLLTPP